MTLLDGFEHDTPWENVRVVVSPTCCFPKDMTLNLEGVVMAPSLPGNVGWVEHLIGVIVFFFFFSFVVRCCGYLADCRAKKTKKMSPVRERGKLENLVEFLSLQVLIDAGFYILTLFSQMITVAWQRVIRSRMTMREMNHVKCWWRLKRNHTNC